MLRNTFLMPTDLESIEAGPEAIEPSAKLDPNAVELPVDLLIAGDSIIVHAPIVAAGINDITVSIVDMDLTITKNSVITDAPGSKYYVQECYWDRLSRTITLPQPVDINHTKATLTDGVLTITLPLLHKPGGKVIRVK